MDSIQTEIAEVAKKSCTVFEVLEHKKSEFEHKDVKILFPYPELYQLQKEYMSKVIDALENRQNAILESPTGTGKTMCILSAVMAWLNKNYQRNDSKNIENLNPPQIYYVVRTHSQGKQIVDQLKKSCYKVRLACISSKEKSCVKLRFNELKGITEDINTICRRLINPNQSSGCKYNDRYKSGQLGDFDTTGMLDIEESNLQAYNCGICNNFYQKDSAKIADIIVMPYVYLTDSNLRSTMTFENSIIIIDEAHNIDKSLENSSKFCISLEKINFCIKELKTWQKSKELTLLEHLAEELILILEIIQKNMSVKKEFYEKLADKKGKDYYLEEKTEIIKTIFGENEREMGCSENLWNLTMFFERIKALPYEESPSFIPNEIYELFDQFRLLSDVLGSIHFGKDQFKLIYQNKSSSDTGKKYNKNDFEISLICVSPAFLFSKIMDCCPRSIILTSGTMTPLDMYPKMLEADFPIQLVNPHLIDAQKQFKMITVGKSNDVELILTSKKRGESEAQMMIEIGHMIDKICNTHEYGMLIIFPNKKLLKDCYYNYWMNAGTGGKSILKSIEEKKKIYIEEGKDFDKEISGYFKEAETPRGAIFLSVARGKASEGINFEDNKARTAIMIGIPFANISDPYVENKIHFMKKVYGEWYTPDTMNVVNQSIGRVIRHKNDYGIVYLFDSRYESSKYRKYLPNWVTKYQCNVSLPGGRAEEVGSEFLKECSKLKLGQNIQNEDEDYIDPVHNSEKRKRESTQLLEGYKQNLDLSGIKLSQKIENKNDFPKFMRFTSNDGPLNKTNSINDFSTAINEENTAEFHDNKISISKDSNLNTPKRLEIRYENPNVNYSVDFNKKSPQKDEPKRSPNWMDFVYTQKQSPSEL